MKVAAVQMEIALGNVDANVNKIVSRLKETTSKGAQLTVFPECAATGYCFESLDEARPFAEPLPGPITERLRKACAEFSGYAVFGMLEAEGERIFNAAVLVGPAGLIGSYRKVHLPYLGVDRFSTPGDRPFAVHDAGALKVGMNICYDAAFPEAARSLALLGADLIALPTNWPPGAECVAEHVVHARAMENAVYYLSANRVGTERGFPFIARSSICDPGGKPLALATGEGEEILYAEVDPQRARDKHIRRVPDKHEIDRFADRRPEMYPLLTQPHQRKTPRQKH